MPGKSGKKPTGLMALAGETAKMAQNMMVLDKTEAELEKEMEKEEKRAKPTTKIDKIRRKGEHMIHGKYLLLLVVILNVIDCLLVLGELILDIKYVTDLLTKEYERSEEFIGSMKGLYPVKFGYLGPKDIEILEDEILKATLTWDSHNAHGSHDDGHGDKPENTSSHNPTTLTSASPALNQPSRKRRASDELESAINRVQSVIYHSRVIRASVDHDTSLNNNQSHHGNDTSHHGGHSEHHHEHSIEEKIAHGLHKASISILGILVVETIFKIFCFGKEMLGHKLECFDSVIVIVSFTIDIVFIKGLQQFTVQEFVLILAFMVPWRVIRVVNSLVVAIMDHEHFRLVLLYKQKKKVSQELKEAKDENKGLEACIDALQKMCADAGIPETLVNAKLNMYRKVKGKGNAVGALSNFALGGQSIDKPFVNGDIKPSTVDIVDETQNTQAKQLEDVLSGESTVSKSKEDISGNSQGQGVVPSNRLLSNVIETERPRSRSALEPRVMENDDNELVKLLAKNSASFIATMNKDDVDLRLRIDALQKKKQEEALAAEAAKERDESSKSSDTSSTDSYDSKQKPDTDDLVKDKRNENNDDDDAPVSRL